MKHIRSRTLLILPLCVGFLAIGFLAGCPWSPGKNPVIPTPPSDYLPQISPANVLANLQRAYTDKKIEEYEKLFAQDFTFVFDPKDAADPDNPTPVQWGLADEREATNNMFRNELVSTITLASYTLGVPERADSLTYGSRAWKVRVDKCNLQVATRNEAGEPLIYIVEGTTEVFFFREDPTKPIDGRPTWYIFRWEDQPFGTGKSTPPLASGRSNV